MIDRLRRPLILVVAAALAAFVFWIDSIARYDFSVAIMYLTVLVLVSAAGSGKAVVLAAQACVALASRRGRSPICTNRHRRVRFDACSPASPSV